ncbi:hypothetical protein DPEC_G00171470 [Dallia pectoralis]|uniref:Uncharacterized protein n=1 Tax=Dallia pectoralis TaxID=75939 RepID=A0ACC2GDV1_DALPE|nr:hypothetical protein DPEC_G00171470 [Dallia pectoralis]
MWFIWIKKLFGQNMTYSNDGHSANHDLPHHLCHYCDGPSEEPFILPKSPEWVGSDWAVLSYSSPAPPCGWLVVGIRGASCQACWELRLTKTCKGAQQF